MKDNLLFEVAEFIGTSNNISIFKQYTNYTIQTGIPNKYLEEDIKVKITFIYENIYRNEYYKEIQFDIIHQSFNIKNILIEKATRRK